MFTQNLNNWFLDASIYSLAQGITPDSSYSPTTPISLEFTTM